ncbi:MAG: hypothetical protein AB7P04_14285 [Bacteriovoracia bacterium]
MSGVSPFLLTLPVLFQGLAMVFDEFIFHRRRGLPRWERIGHPIDTVGVLLCLGWLLSRPPESGPLFGYALLAVGSCLLVTKDEWVHAGRCSRGEHWLHALLFVLHPMVLAANAVLWWQGQVSPWLWAQLGAMIIFLLYQVFYWNYFFTPERVPERAGHHGERRGQ